MVVMLGWWGSSDNAVSKFAQCYVDRGIPVLRFTALSSENFTTELRRRRVADALLGEIDRICADGVGRGGNGQLRLVFHLMSNNGALMYLSVLDCAREDCRFQWVLPAIKGTVYDCAPGDLTPGLFVKAVLAMKPPLSLRLALLAPPLGAVTLMAWALRCGRGRLAAVVLTAAVVFSMRSNAHNTSYHAKIAADPTTCPQLFLYSANDVLVTRGVVESMLERRRARGVAVMSRCFAGLAHMELLRGGRSEYEQALDEFLLAVRKLYA